MSLIGISHVNAQSSLIATLSHENDVKVFYGASALKEAHAAAVGGDVITLSSGTFNACDITKAITLRGAGMAVDTVYNNEPTIITGDFKICVADTVNRFTLEGVYNNNEINYDGTLEKAMFIKCRLKSIDYKSANGSILKNATFLHCRISDQVNLYTNSSASMINCIVEDPQTYGNAVFEFVNCILIFPSYNYVSNSTYKNCFINYARNSSNYIKESCVAYNCIGFGGDVFKYMTNSTNKIVSDLSSLFKTYTTITSLNNLDSETFELTEDAKTKYLGIDGTQIGIYGGAMPFEITPTNPQIQKCNVAAKSTVDGKLSVDIQVNVAE